MVNQKHVNEHSVYNYMYLCMIMFAYAYMCIHELRKNKKSIKGDKSGV